MKANAWAAVAWVNALRSSDDEPALVVYDTVVENVDQRITLRVLANRFKARDTAGEMRKLVEAQFGPLTAQKVSDNATEYEWQLSTWRWVRLIYKPDAGTFIQLIDKGLS